MKNIMINGKDRFTFMVKFFIKKSIYLGILYHWSLWLIGMLLTFPSEESSLAACQSNTSAIFMKKSDNSKWFLLA